ncbi:MAG TPA: hypothetical protein VN698_00645 [Bacteroidia bacterium]|nr:hypothetical protein [Bacteroidia bacterium]
MNKLIKNTLYFFLLVVIISYPLSIYITSNFSTYNKQTWVLNKSGLKFDYAVLGSSRVNTMIDIHSLDTSFEKKGINIGTTGAGYAENYLVLSEFTEKNKINTLILNTDEFSFNSVKWWRHPFHDYEFLPLFKKYNDVFYDYIPTWKFYLWKLIPLTKYLEYNERFHVKKMDQKKWDLTMGSQLSDSTQKQDEKVFQKNQLQILKNQEPLKELDKKYFIKILELCSTKKIKVLFITTPIYSKNNAYRNAYFSTYLDSVSKAFNIKYYGFENLIKSDNITLFTDNNHMNRMGAIEYSINLGKELKKNNE